MVADEPARRACPALETDTLHGRRRRARRVAARAVLRFAEALSPPLTDACAVLPIKRFGAAKQRLDKTSHAGTRRALAEAMVTDVLIALRRAERVDEVLVVTGETVADALAARPTTPPAITTTRTPATRAAAVPASTGRSSAATTACCSCPATARRSTRARSTR